MASFVVTCEHASPTVPPSARDLFRGRTAQIRSHRGWDPGAAVVARALARLLHAPLVCGRYTRLLVDLNRSPTNRAVFSSITRTLPPGARADLLVRHHAPHWAHVRREIEQGGRGLVIHVAVHSFIPVLDGKARRVDVGLLYDPGRVEELRLGGAWQRSLRGARPGLRVRRNAPYRGRSDGLPSALRTMYPPHRYVGIELELNQSWLRSQPRDTASLLAHTLRAATRAA